MRAMREGIRAQGHSAVFRSRMEELFQGTAKSQQRLEEAERRAWGTAGERPAKRSNLQFGDRLAIPRAPGGSVAQDAVPQDAGNAVAGGVSQDATQDTAMSGGLGAEENRTEVGSVCCGEDQ